MKLNIEKIYAELDRIGKNKFWLSKEIPTSPQLVSYWLRTKSHRGAGPIAKVFKMDPKDLIK